MKVKTATIVLFLVILTACVSNASVKTAEGKYEEARQEFELAITKKKNDIKNSAPDAILKEDDVRIQKTQENLIIATDQVSLEERIRLIEEGQKIVPTISPWFGKYGETVGWFIGVVLLILRGYFEKKRALGTILKLTPQPVVSQISVGPKMITLPPQVNDLSNSEQRLVAQSHGNFGLPI